MSKADFYTESTRSGFLNLVTEIESADVQGPQMAFGSTQNCKVIGVFCLNTSPTSSPTLEHLEVCSSSMKSNIPIPLMKQNPNSTRQKTNFDAFIPNLSMVISEFEVTVSYEKLSWSSSLSNVRISHNKVENKSEITTDEIAISDDKGKDINDQVLYYSFQSKRCF